MWHHRKEIHELDIAIDKLDDVEEEEVAAQSTWAVIDDSEAKLAVAQKAQLRVANYKAELETAQAAEKKEVQEAKEAQESLAQTEKIVQERGAKLKKAQEKVKALTGGDPGALEHAEKDLAVVRASWDQLYPMYK